ncbi:MAG: AAA family ATPase [Solirubrobacteraceae bacterium]
MRSLLLTGPPGAGKTATLTALMGRLEADDVRYAAVEVEALALVHPWPDDDAALDHLGFVADSFARRGYPLLLASATITDPDYLTRVRAALPEGDLLFVCLMAPPEVLRARLVAREPPDWVGLPGLLRASDELAESMVSLPGLDLVLETATQPVEHIVEAIHGRLVGR